MVNVDGLLARKVSYQASAWSLPTDEPSLQEVLNDIRECRYAEQILHLRYLISRGEREQYGVEKKRLPGVTFSGTFDGRRQIGQLKTYNDLLVLDIDDMSKDALMAASSALREDIHVLAYWMSPSAEGLKGLVALSFSEELEQLDVVPRHRSAFALVSNYFKQTYDICLDQSGSDITRLCFLSSDPALYFRLGSAPFMVSEIPDSMRPRRSNSPERRSAKAFTASKATPRHLLYRTEGKNEACDRAVMGSVIKYLEKRHLSITASYERWVRVALAIASTFTYDVGKQYFLR
ncbi:MAG: BT4734/BF3469 family protein, partial [Methylobacter sp.]